MTIVDNSTLDLQNVQNAIVENSLSCCSLLPQRLVVRRSILSSERVKEAPIKIRIFGPKTAKFGPKYAFLVILGQIMAFFAHFVPCTTKKQCAQVGFLLCG